MGSARELSESGGCTGGIIRVVCYVRRLQVTRESSDRIDAEPSPRANLVVWLVMVAILVVVPDSLERWMSLEVARVVGWAVAVRSGSSRSSGNGSSELGRSCASFSN